MAGNLLFRLLWGERPAGRLQRVAEELAQPLIGSQLKLADASTELVDLLADKLAIGPADVASEFSSAAEIGKERLPAQAPGPFLELEAESVQVLVEQSLRVQAGGQHGANFGRDVD